MNVLAVTNLYPNCKEPGRGIFNHQQFLKLRLFCELNVIAPLPWAPKWIGNHLSEVPVFENIDGMDIYHPRYFVTPKIGRRFYGVSYFKAIYPLVQKAHTQKSIDVIFATWGYPDCYGAALAARRLNIPLVCRVHGTDINIGAQDPAKRGYMKKAFQQAVKVIANSSDLKQGVKDLGIPEDKIEVIINGVDTDKFYPQDRDQSQAKLGLKTDRRHILFIGNLVEIKGVEYLIKSLSLLSEDLELHIIGTGALKESLEKLSQRIGVQNRVIFHGRISHDDVPLWMNASDVLCLPSFNEGCPNVVMEALACQLPVAASSVGGIVDMIDHQDKGQLFIPGDSEAIAKAIRLVLQNLVAGKMPSSRISSWKENAKKVFHVLQEASS